MDAKLSWPARLPAAGRLLLPLVAVLVLWQNACANWPQVFRPGGAVDFVDADCYARMTRVRLLCADPWHAVRRHTFENSPFGVVPHTTMPLDYAVAALRGVLGVFTRGDALDLAGAWVSPLLGAAAVVALWWWLASRGLLATGWPGLFVLGLSPMVAHGFQLGRPDHQSLVLLCMAVALAAEWALWQRPARGWGIASGVAWAVGLWTSLYEPLVLLALVLIAGAIWNRRALLARERWPGWAAGGVVLLAALLLEGWRVGAVPGYGVGPGDAYFAAWSRQIGELRGVAPWSPALYGWTGFGLLAAPVLLWLAPGEWRPIARAQLFVLLAVFALTCWQVRWGYFLPLVYALSLPWQFAVVPPRWRVAAVVLLILGLLPMGNERRASRDPEQAVALAEQRTDSTQLREAAAFIRQAVADASAAPDSPSDDEGLPFTGILAPWWQSPALAYWSGQPGVAGSSHESLGGTVDAARFYVSADAREAGAILRRRRVRWVVAYEPARVLQTSGNLLDRPRVPARCLAELLYRRPDLAPRFLRLALANPAFKVYEVRPALLPPPA